NNLKGIKAFHNDQSLRDSSVSFLNLYFNVFNQDYAKIIDMEEVADQSYDLMEAFLLAQELANNKLEKASENLDRQNKLFADKYGINLVEGNDKTSLKLKNSSEVLNYHNKVYLVLFKAQKQEMYLLNAIEQGNLIAVEQNRNALLSISNEGLSKLLEIKSFKGDNSINSACKKVLLFYKDEVENKMTIITEFLLIKEEYEKTVTLFESKDKSLLTSEEINKYNEMIVKYNNGVNKFNTINTNLYNKRINLLNNWDEAAIHFKSKHIPKN
ncbi:MAG: hypothetical protein OEY34_01310, partial [Cyclobacteriaceae bacterium]|nr:hypothetical protein [Cyclobacteriaceae bacterium]